MRIVYTLCAVLLLGIWFGNAHAAPPECIPGLYGQQFPGTKVHPLQRGDKGWYGWGWCTAADGSPYAIYRLCAHGECASDIGTAVGHAVAGLGLAAIGSDAKTVYGGWWEANPPDYSCGSAPSPDTPRGQACAELNALLSADRPAWTPPPPPPPAATWKVKRNPQSTTTPTTRPVYILSADASSMVITTKPAERVPEGLPCGAPLKASGADGYGVPQGFAAPKVALCEKTSTTP